MRKQIYYLVEKVELHNKCSKIYEWFIMIVAVMSILPLMFKGSDSMPIFIIMDRITVYILFFDYILRWLCHDYKTHQSGAKPFLEYPFTPFAIVDLLSLLPSLGVLGNHFRILRMLRIFKLLHYSKNFVYISRVFKKEAKTLYSVLLIAIFYIFVSALAMFAYEPDTFDNFFGALYWATTALTTVGYGDVYPVCAVGSLISMISSLFGIAVIALPAGIITAGFMQEINLKKEEDEVAEVCYEAEQDMDKATGADKEKKESSKLIIKKYAFVMLFGVVINQVFSWIASIFKLPLWLDTVGTILVTLILEPTAGLLVGLLDNFYIALMTHDNTKLFYYATSAAVVLLVGVFLKKDGKICRNRILPCMMLVIVVSSVISILLALVRTNGITDGSAEQVFFKWGVEMGLAPVAASAVGIVVVKILDTMVTFFLVAVFYRLYSLLLKRKG